ncbi:MAG: hypothetical protein QMC77_05935, partial [Methanocellales archaeon]|nr:hypothetical protein [Methanocellales archaeon]
IIACGVSPKALLITMTGPYTGLGLILVEVERAVEKIKEWGTAMQIRSGIGFLKWLGGSACAEFMIGLFFAAVAISFGIAVHWHYFPFIIVGLLIALHGYYREFG